MVDVVGEGGVVPGENVLTWDVQHVSVDLMHIR